METEWVSLGVLLVVTISNALLAVDRWVHRRRAEEVKLGSDGVQLVKDLADCRGQLAAIERIVTEVVSWKIQHSTSSQLEFQHIKLDIQRAYRRIEALERKYAHRRAGDGNGIGEGSDHG